MRNSRQPCHSTLLLLSIAFLILFSASGLLYSQSTPLPAEDTPFAVLDSLARGHWDNLTEAESQAWIHLLESQSRTPEQTAKVGLHRSRFHFFNGENDLANTEIKRTLALAKTLENPQLLGDCEILLGELHRDQGDRQRALAHANAAIGHFQATKHVHSLVFAYFLKSSVLIRMADFEKAVPALDSLEVYAKLGEDPGLIGAAYTLRSQFFTSQGKFGDALAFAQKAEPFILEEGEGFHLANHWQYTASLFYDHQNYETSEIYYQRSIHLSDSLGFSLIKASAQNGLAALLLATGDTTQSIDNYLSALKLFRSLQYRTNEAITCNNLSRLYGLTQDFQSALFYGRQGFVLAQTLNDPESSSMNAYHLGYAFIRMTEYDSALTYFTYVKSHTQNQKLNYLTHQQLSLTHEGLGDPIQALAYQRKVSQLKDEMDVLAANKYADSLEISLQSAQPVSGTTPSNWQSALIIALSLLLLGAILGFLLWKRKQPVPKSASAQPSPIVFSANDVQLALQAKDWPQIMLLFEHAHPGLIQNLFRQFPTLSATDHRVIVLTHMSLSVSEMSEIMGISIDGAKKARQRTRKKLGLLPADSLQFFLSQQASSVS